MEKEAEGGGEGAEDAVEGGRGGGGHPKYPERRQQQQEEEEEEEKRNKTKKIRFSESRLIGRTSLILLHQSMQHMEDANKENGRRGKGGG